MDSLVPMVLPEHEPLHVLDALHRLAAGGDQDVAEEQPRRRGRAAVHHLDQSQPAALAEPGGERGRQRCRRPGDARYARRTRRWTPVPR
jgi:hypothetical protein